MADNPEVFRFLHRFYKINLEILFEMNNMTVTIGDGMKFKLQRCNTIARKSLF